MHRLTAIISDLSNAFQNKNISINERVCVSPPPYYLDWFKISYPNFPLNRYDGPFFLQRMNGIHGTKPARRKWNRLLDAVVTILKYKKIRIYHTIYIRFLSDETVSYITVSTDDILNTNNNETVFPELTRVFEEHCEMKFQEGYVLKYLNFRMFQSPLGFSVDQTDHIMELVNEWFQTGNLRKVDTPFSTYYTYEKELMSALTLTVNALHKAEIEDCGKFEYNLGRMQHISIIIRVDICYATCRLKTQTVAPTLPGFQVINICVQYLYIHPHKTILYPSNSYDGSNVIRLTWNGNQVED